jgi:uncharacterized membrane protein YedE/YeeE
MEMDWVYGLLGGLLIGLGGAVFLLANGRIMGASGIVGGLVDGTGRAGQVGQERLIFIAGLVAVPALMMLMGGTSETNVTSNIGVLIAAGLLVGVGTRIANGCTSGHGVCGISRFSVRGIVATLIYIGAGAITVALFRHALGVI